MTDKRILVLRGCPGSGKSSVSKSLLSLRKDLAVIEVDKIRLMMAGNDWERSADHTEALQASLALMDAFLGTGRTPVLVDTFTPYRMRWLETRLRERHLAWSVVTLVGTWDTIVERLRSRQHGFRDEERTKWMHDENGAASFDGEVKVDTTGKTPEEVARAVIQNMGGVDGQ